jgi:hypothetical protein
MGPAKLHVVCRSVGSENAKNRPAYYDKTLALASLVRAAGRSGLPTELVFVNDGPVPARRCELMATAGEVLQVDCGSNRASLRRVLSLPRERGWSGEDLVWFAEDDYLYAADAFAGVAAAARELRWADYFALYSELRFDPRATRGSPVLGERTRAQGDPHAVTLGRARWYRAVSTTSTFGARVQTLLADERLLRTAPFVGGAFDHATCLALQGYRPFGLAELGGAPLDSAQASGAKRAARRAALTAARLALDAVALARPDRARRIIVAPDPDLATHLEEGALAPGTDWGAESATVAGWLDDHRLPPQVRDYNSPQ